MQITIKLSKIFFKLSMTVLRILPKPVLNRGGIFPALLVNAHQELALQTHVLKTDALRVCHIRRFDTVILNGKISPILAKKNRSFGQKSH